MKNGRPIKNLLGQNFGRLIVIEFYGIKKEKAHWLCQCSCGNTAIVMGSKLTCSVKLSCGCLPLELLLKRSIKHGMTGTRFYNIWQGMVQRTTNSKSKDYLRYGGRGIKINSLWRNFENFKKDLFDSYQIHVREYGEKNTTIDRIDNNKGYYQGNIRWATQIKQQNNRRNNKKISFKGKTKNLYQWAKSLNISGDALSRRIYKYKWTLERALTTFGYAKT